MSNVLDHQTNNFSITDEYGEKSTISIDKWAAELLVKNLDDAHKWIQDTYDRAVSYNASNDLKLSRRKIGDLVRQKAYREAGKYDEVDF